MSEVTIGLRDHSGWGAAVTVGWPPSGRPEVLDRRRLLLCAPELPRQVYHAAVDEPPGQAAALVAEVEASAAAHAGRELAALIDELRAAGHRVRAVAVAVGTARVPAELSTILGSHPLLHAAEGELYREALADAARATGVPVVRHVARSLAEQVPQDAVARLGAGLGPPWARDQRDAAAAALLAFEQVASRPE